MSEQANLIMMWTYLWDFVDKTEQAVNKVHDKMQNDPENKHFQELIENTIINIRDWAKEVREQEEKGK